MLVNQKKWGIITGSSILLMAVLAGFVYGYVHSLIYNPDNSNLTSQLLEENLTLYKLGITSWIAIIVLDIVVSFGLYIIFKEDKKILATVSSILRILYTVILGIAVIQLVIPIINLGEKANSIIYFESFEKIWSLGLIIFGIHLLTLGVICYVSGFRPKFFSIFLGFGGLSYVLVESLNSFFPSLSGTTSTIESILIAPMALSELSFAAWLVIKYYRQKRTY